MGTSQTLRSALLNWYKGSSFTTAPTTLYVALLTTNPSDDAGTGLVEVVNGSGASQWNGYARQPITTSSGWSAITTGSPSSISNAAIINFGTATISSGTITVTGIAIYSALTTGTLYDWVVLGEGNEIVSNTNTLAIAIGSLVLQA